MNTTAQKKGSNIFFKKEHKNHNACGVTLCTSIEHTASVAAVTVEAEYPNGEINPAFLSFSYSIAS